MARIHVILFLLTALTSLLVSAAAPTFCKCTCFTNSTIIPLGPQHDSPPPKQPSTDADKSTTATTDPHLRPRLDDLAASIAPRGAPSSSCAQCNRAFCLRYNLPICKGAEEKDVTTMCFRRDSLKDQVIVWGFILGTVGLLGWAAARRLLEMRDVAAAALPRAGSGPVSGSAGGRGSAGGGSRPVAGFGWASFLRRRGSPAGGSGLNPREDAARGAYSPIGIAYDGDGR